MKECFVGVGGWTYFQVSEPLLLTAYSKNYNFVEVNSTYCDLPTDRKVELWRKSVPENFWFSVRSHYSITHNIMRGSSRKAHEMFEKMCTICHALKTEFLLLQFPPPLEFDEGTISRLKDFLKTVKLDYIQLIFEMKIDAPRKLPKHLIEVMQENHIIHCVDLLRGQLPAYKSETLYSRLFGRSSDNLYQPTDEELANIHGICQDYEKVYLAFHGSKKYVDASRIKFYDKTGEFPMVTAAVGLPSLEAILMERIRFPITKADILNDHGWKLFDLSKGKRIRTIEYLKQLPEKTYNSFDELKQELKSICLEC